MVVTTTANVTTEQRDIFGPKTSKNRRKCLKNFDEKCLKSALVHRHLGVVVRRVVVLFELFFRTLSNKFFRPDKPLRLGRPELNGTPVALPVGVAQKKDLKEKGRKLKTHFEN